MLCLSTPLHTLVMYCHAPFVMSDNGNWNTPHYQTHAVYFPL